MLSYVCTAKQELKQRTFARYRSMQYGVNRGGDCRAEFLLKILVHIRDCQVSRGLSSSPDKKWQKKRFLSPHCVWRPIATQPPRVASSTLHRLKVDFVGYIFAADSMRLPSFKFSWRAPKDARSTSRSAYWPFKVIRGRWFSCHLKGLMRLPISDQ